MEKQLDVSTLEPCEPLERILAILPTLQPGEYLKVLHRMEPHPLYKILEQQGFQWITRQGTTTPIELFIWRQNDQQAAHLVQTTTHLS